MILKLAVNVQWVMEEVARHQSSSVALHENKIICSGWEGRKSSYFALLGPSETQ